MENTEIDPFHLVSPLLKSLPLEKHAGVPVYIKLDNCQPSGSFKMRGLGRLVQKFSGEGFTHFVTSSGGNAGLAVAYAAKQLGRPTTIFVPKSTDIMIVKRLEDLGATVLVRGKVWNDADAAAKEFVASSGAEFVYVPPFEHRTVWEGNSTLALEIHEQLQGIKPSCIILSVGGGGLLIGTVLGLQKVGWHDVPVIAMETEGANCFSAALKAGRIVTLDDITSIATTLGTKTVSEKAFKLAHEEQHPIISREVSDADVVEACLKFSDDERHLVEPACGATLSAIYKGILKSLVNEGKISNEGPAVAVICGGSRVTLDLLAHWKKQFEVY